MHAPQLGALGVREQPMASATTWKRRSLAASVSSSRRCFCLQPTRRPPKLARIGASSDVWHRSGTRSPSELLGVCGPRRGRGQWQNSDGGACLLRRELRRVVGAVTGALRAREGLTLLGVYAMRDEAISLASQGSEISFPRSKGFSAQLRTRHHRSKGGWRGRKGRITFHLAGGTICCITGAKTGQELAERDIPVPEADGQGKKTNAVHRNSR